MWTRGWREEIWSRLDQPWDLRRDRRRHHRGGHRSRRPRATASACCLVEGQDFASGTSSRSTKLVHGGLRYLRQGQFLVTRKSVRERERLMTEAPGLVDRPGLLPSPPTPATRCPSGCTAWASMMYDALAWKWAHRGQDTREAIVERIPSAAQAPPCSAATTTSTRRPTTPGWCSGCMREATRRGATALSYVKRTSSCSAPRDGRVRGASCSRDTAPGASRDRRGRGEGGHQRDRRVGRRCCGPTLGHAEAAAAHPRQPPHLRGTTACRCPRP
jgi:glycerol-3-phosphate dehydrogenase